MDWSIEIYDQNGKICTFIFCIFLLAKQLCVAAHIENESQLEYYVQKTARKSEL